MRLNLVRYPVGTYQDQRRVVELIPGVDVRPLGDGLLARFQIPPPASLTETAKSLCEVEGILLLQPPISNELRLLIETGFQLVFS